MNTTQVQSVDGDLTIKPFFQKKASVSLRDFANTAFNHHHGTQSVERFGKAQTGTDDFDEDGAPDEISVGDVTVITVFQAALGNPGRVYPSDANLRQAVDQGEDIF
ncbi:MAG: hypothetical protein ABI165_10395 [Bryobacteraceae bacterium]